MKKTILLIILSIVFAFSCLLSVGCSPDTTTNVTTIDKNEDDSSSNDGSSSGENNEGSLIKDITLPIQPE